MDVTQQWRELQENYLAMADEELAAVAQEAYDLTDVARQALQAEVSRRHLPVILQLQAPTEEDEKEQSPPKGYPPGFDPADWGLIHFTYADSLERAREIKKCFDDAGVPSYYGPNLVDDLRLLPSPFPRSVEVQVRETDQPRAIAVLSRCAPPTADEAEEEIPDYSGHCPQCHSTEIVLQGLDASGEESAAAPKYSWSCDACGYQWKDDGIESES